MEPDSLLFYFGKLDEREGIFTQAGNTASLLRAAGAERFLIEFSLQMKMRQVAEKVWLFEDGASLAHKIFEKLGNEAKEKPWNDAAMKPFVDAGVAEAQL